MNAPRSENQSTQEAILETACKLFADHGFDKVGIRLIAKEAEVQLSSINYHFGTKERLYEAAFQLSTKDVLNIPSLVDDVMIKMPHLMETPEGQSKAIHYIISNYFETFYRYYSIDWQRRFILRVLGEKSPFNDKMREATRTQSHSLFRLYGAIRPDFIFEDAYVWVFLPFSHSNFFLVLYDILGQFYEEGFREKIYKKITESTINMMITSLDLPLLEDYSIETHPEENQ